MNPQEALAKIEEAIQITRQVSRHCEQRIPLLLQTVDGKMVNTEWYPSMVMVIIEQDLDTFVTKLACPVTTTTGFMVGIERGKRDDGKLVVVNYTSKEAKYPSGKVEKTWTSEVYRPDAERILKLVTADQFVAAIRTKLEAAKAKNLEKASELNKKLMRLSYLANAPTLAQYRQEHKLSLN